MAATRPEALLRVLACLALACLAMATAGPAWAGAAGGEFVINADGIQIDYANNTLRMPNVDILQESPRRMRIRAEEAVAKGSEPKFDNSEWEFKGAVRIEFADGELEADSATVRFAGNQLAHALVTGAPARFSHQIKGSSRRSQGRARTIEYDLPRNRLRLAGGAWYSDGSNEVETEALVYNLADRSVQNERGPNPENRVRMTIRPEKPGTEKPGPEKPGTETPAPPKP